MAFDGMTRYLFWLLLFYLAWRWWRRLQIKLRRDHQPVPPSHAERMLSCQSCRIYLPEREGLIVAGHFFCSDKCCRQAGLAPPGAKH